MKFVLWILFLIVLASAWGFACAAIFTPWWLVVSSSFVGGWIIGWMAEYISEKVDGWR